MLQNPIDNAVIRIRPLMLTPQPLKPRVPSDPQSNPIPTPQFLQFRHDTVRDHGCDFRVQTIHHGLHHLQLLLYGKVQEVGVHEDGVWWSEGGVEFEEE